MKALYYTLGNSDVSIDSNQRFYNFRELTCTIYDFIIQCKKLDFNNESINITEDFSYKIQFQKDNTIEEMDKVLKKIEFPIFTSLFNKLKEHNRTPVVLYLFATNQSNTNAQRQDTIFLAKILEYYCKVKLKIEEIKIIEIEKNPADFTAMLMYFEDFVKTHIQQIKINLHNTLQLTAGTPQSYYALAQNMQNMPGVRYYYISRENGKSIAYESSAFGKLNMQNYLEIIKSDIEKFNYASALNVVKKSPFSHQTHVINFLELLMFKRNFVVKQESIEIARKLAEKDTYFEVLYDELFQWINKNNKAYFTEFYNQIEAALINENFIVVIALIFSMLDNLRQIIVEKLFDIKIENGISEALGSKITAISGDNNKFSKTDSKKLHPCKPTKPVLEWVIDYFAKSNSEIAKIYNETKSKFDCFHDIRNHGPFAHGYSGIDKDLFIKTYGANVDKVLSDIRILLTSLDLLNPKYSYKEYNAKIILLLKEEFKELGSF